MPHIYSNVYQPYTYDELIKPLQASTEAHKAQELAFDQLMTDADKMSAFLDKDWQSYKDYAEYINNLNVAAEDLSNNGITTQNSGNFMRLKRNYDTKIQAINAGILSRQNTIDTFNKSEKGQSSRYIGARPEDYSVDEYMYGKMPFKLGVDGSEINKYAMDSAKAMTSRIYKEYTEGGWEINEVGVDPFVTKIVIDKLRHGGQQISKEEAAVYRLGERQVDYMNSVISGLLDIEKDTRETFGYDRFTGLDENGNKIYGTPNQNKFDAELFNGISNGIVYARKNEADPYSLAAYKDNLERRRMREEQEYELIKEAMKNGKGKNSPELGFGLMDIDFVNKDPVKAINSLALKQGKNGLEAVPLDLNYHGQKIHFNSKLDAYRWAYQGENIGELREQRNELKRMLDKGSEPGYKLRDFVREIEDTGFANTMKRLGKQNIDVEREYFKLDNKINEIEKIRAQRVAALQAAGYFMSDREYRNIAETYGFDKNDNKFDIEDIRNATQGSMMNVEQGLVHGIRIVDASGTSAGADQKTNYSDSSMMKKLKGAVSSQVSANVGGQRKIDLYDIGGNRISATKQPTKYDNAVNIIRRAVSVYTTLELMTGYNGTDKGNQKVPLAIFEDPEGNRIGVPISSLGPEFSTIVKEIQMDIEEPNILTNPNRVEVEKKAAQRFYSTTKEVFGE